MKKSLILISSVKQILIRNLLAVPMISRNVVHVYNIWCAVLIVCYYELFFKEVHFFSSHTINFIATCIVNLITYMCARKIKKIHNVLFDEVFSAVCIIVLAVKVMPPRNGIVTKLHLYDLIYDWGFQTTFEFFAQCGSTVVFGVILTYSSEIFYEVNRKKSKYINIKILDITLHNATYKRLNQTCSWLTKKYSIDHRDIGLLENAHVLLFGTSESLDDYKSFPLAATDIENTKRTSYTSVGSARHVGQLIVDTYAQRNVPFLIVVLINIDENGNIQKNDKQLIGHFKTDFFPRHENDVLYVTRKPVYSDFESISKDIQYKLNVKNDVNTVYCRVFDTADGKDDLKKRIGLHLERKLHASIICSAERLLKQIKTEDDGVTDSSILYNNVKSSVKVGHLNEIISQFRPSFPDNCAMHELQILLERNKYVKAYGFDDNTIKVYVEEEERKSSVQAYLYKYFPECKDHVYFQLWDCKPAISKCHLKQGSKVVRSDSKHGTLGMFLRDQKGNIYFTTCSHVIEKDRDAYGTDKTVIGKSVYSIDSGPDTNVSDLLDLSIVKVEEALKTQCHLGLRDAYDNQVAGQIADEDDIHLERHKNLKVYKWGATTNLTTGTYKGWIASKDCSDRFDKNLHRIVGESNKFFAEGDSGSLVCFEATGSPNFDTDSAGFIFIGKLMSTTECAPTVSSPDEWYYCYHVSKVFDKKIENVENLEPCLDPEYSDSRGFLKSGQMLQA